jgi:hypothetical protein
MEHATSESLSGQAARKLNTESLTEYLIIFAFCHLSLLPINPFNEKQNPNFHSFHLLLYGHKSFMQTKHSKE